MYKKIAVSVIALLLFLGYWGNTIAQAADSKELLQSMKLYSGLQTIKGSIIQITSPKDGTLINSLEDIRGNYSGNSEILRAYLVQEEKLITLGTTIISEMNTESFRIPIEGSRVQKSGLITLYVSDEDISKENLKQINIEKSRVYLSPENEATPTDQTKIMIREVQLIQNDSVQAQLEAQKNTYFIENVSEKVKARIQGFVFGITKMDSVSSLVIPSQDQQISEISIEANNSFTLDLEIQVSTGTNTLILQKLSEGMPMSTTNDSYTFVVKESTEYQSILSSVFSEILFNKDNLLLVILMIISVGLWRKTNSLSQLARYLGLTLLLLEIFFCSGFIGMKILNNLYESGLIQLPGREERQLQTTELYEESITLTQIDENLNLKPGISKSWSNIEPTIWEFQIRKSDSNLQAQDVIDGLKELQESSSQNPYLSSIRHVIAINDDSLQFITGYPDPLLAHKLSKVEIPLKREKTEQAFDFLKYKTTEISGNREERIKNEKYYNKAFEEQSAEKEIRISSNNEPLQKSEIKNQSIQSIDNPSPGLWPTLFQNNYTIKPQINSESIFLLIRRDQEKSLSREEIFRIRDKLQSGALLQTSYFQYGQLANQFAAPGVTGYDPKITPSSGENISEANPPSKSFIMMVPREEKTLGENIQNILNNMRIHTQLIEYDRENRATQIDNIHPDLLLVTINYELGDVGPFYDSLIDPKSPLHHFLKNERAIELIEASRRELNHTKRLETLQEIMNIIVNEDPIGIPLLFKRSFRAEKTPDESSSWTKSLLRLIILGNW